LLRIIGGAYRGRRINVGKGFESRPTTDFAKEALFNILNNHFDFDQITVLDLFGGTGSISFEFASRGCGQIDVVDINNRALKQISENAFLLGTKALHTVHLDTFKFIEICERKYDVIFADPPYSSKNIEKIPGLIFQYQLLNKNGWFILEHSKNYNFSSYTNFTMSRNYGSVHFSFFGL